MLLHKQRGAGEANFRSERRSSYRIKGDILSKQTSASKNRYIIDKGFNMKRSVFY